MCPMQFQFRRAGVVALSATVAAKNALKLAPRHSRERGDKIKMNEKGIKYFSTFSGIGGFELGIERAYRRMVGERGQNTSLSKRRETKLGAGADNKQARKQGHHGTQRCAQAACVGFSELDKYAIQIYQSHFPDHKNYGDITAIDAYALPDFDLYVGGFPCQAFSIAGKRGGFNDTRGTLFFDVARILKAKRPRNFLLENVKGLLSHDNGRTFQTIIATLVELGYGVEWQVLNSKDFGVPQNRERVFIVGHLGGEPARKVFPLGDYQQEAPELSGQHSNTLTTRYYGGQANGTYVIESEFDAQIKQLNRPKHSNDRVYGADGIGPTLNTMQGGNRQPFVKGLAPSIRRLTPIECERLQGFPDGWTEGVSDTQRYKTLGNAVTVNVIEAVIRAMYDKTPN